MTEAITRDGRKVTQLTWFHALYGASYCVYGVLNGMVESWTEEGINRVGCESEKDIFKPVNYEWQWLIKVIDTGRFSVSGHHDSIESVENYGGFVRANGWEIVSRIEESKREAK